MSTERKGDEFTTYITTYGPLGGDNLAPCFRQSLNRRPGKRQVPWKLVGGSAPRDVVYRNDVTVRPEKERRKERGKGEVSDEVVNFF